MLRVYFGGTTVRSKSCPPIIVVVVHCKVVVPLRVLCVVSNSPLTQGLTVVDLTEDRLCLLTGDDYSLVDLPRCHELCSVAGDRVSQPSLVLDYDRCYSFDRPTDPLLRCGRW